VIASVPARRLLAACCLLLFSAASSRADNWPQWRGPDGDGVCKETNLPTTWSATQNVVWKLPLPGRGSSTPAVWGDRLFLTSLDGPNLVLLCISTDGKELWKRKLGAVSGRMIKTEEGSPATSSPCTDGKHVYALVGPGDFAAFDFAGQEIWRFNPQERWGKFRLQFGMHTTPVLHGDRLYLQLLHSGGTWVVAIDKANGKDVWKVKRQSDARNECEHSYASAFLWHNDKDAYLVCHGNDYTTAHRLEDGSEIWRLADLNPQEHYHPTLRFVASPGVSPDLIVVPTAKGGPVVGIKPDASGLVKAGSPAEQFRRPKDTPDVPSPLVHGGQVYLCRENGTLICLDAKTGKEMYLQRLHAGIYRASPVYADGKVYCTARDGTVSVVQAGPEFKLLATNNLPDQIAASPAIANGRIYLRGFQTLYAIELPLFPGAAHEPRIYLRGFQTLYAIGLVGK
jgi:outer membrane protein assembly factor BamB